jgi:integrase
MFLKAPPDERWQRDFISGLDTGCRPSEQLALAWSHVDFERRKIFMREGVVRGRETKLKTKRSRRDMLTVEQALREPLAAVQGRSGDVFPSANGRPVDLADLRNRIW